MNEVIPFEQQILVVVRKNLEKAYFFQLTFTSKNIKSKKSLTRVFLIGNLGWVELPASNLFSIFLPGSEPIEIFEWYIRGLLFINFYQFWSCYIFFVAFHNLVKYIYIFKLRELNLEILFEVRILNANIRWI